ncbi:AraC family transcriptional regulator [Lacticaseibacillus yichunensis]|uniref:Helix-turn-helix domain-containing protein n=1 Tax=Lacticaseibacillus yichunensis TaxID=2486015 RepID=A0ABW4CPD9_9LACO|nr:AraC family transcriptional regulator [Lacticaseibacillus yichunensis]
MQYAWQKYASYGVDWLTEECGWQRCTPLDSYYYTVARDVIVHYVIAGSGWVEIDGQVHPVQRGEFFLLTAGVKVKYGPTLEDPWEYCWLGFGGQMASRILAPLTARGFLIAEMPPAAAKDIVAFTHERVSKTDRKHDTGLRRSRDLIAFVDDFATGLGVVQATRDEEHYDETVAAALAFFNANYTRPISVQDAASQVHISRSYLYRLFIREVNLAPKQYLQRLRLSHAQQLLESTTLPIEVVAAQSGYQDALHFSRQFRSYYSDAPREYRRKKAVDRAYYPDADAK